MRKFGKSNFWKSYKGSKNWSKPSLFNTGTHPGAPVTAAEVFSAVVDLCKPEPESITAAGKGSFRFYVEGKPIKDAEEYLPKVEDRDFHGWNERMRSQFKEYAAAFNRLEKHFGTKIKPIRDFVTEMVEGLGYPTGSADLTLFAGSYKKTPFGVHVDNEVNFYWPIIGPKLMRFWSPEYGGTQWKNATPEQKKDYTDHIEKSLVLKGQPGDLIAWPGSWWHIGESVEFNVSFTIPLYIHTQETLNFELQRQKLLDELIKFSSLVNGKTLVSNVLRPDTSIVVPHFVTGAAKLLTEIYPRRELKEALIQGWVTKVSTAGLDYKLAPMEKKSSSQKWVYRASQPIRWARLNRQKICVACDGNPLLVSRSRAVVSLLKTLNTLEPVGYSDLLKAFGRKKTSKKILNSFLSELIQIGAIEIVMSKESKEEPCKKAA